MRPLSVQAFFDRRALQRQQQAIRNAQRMRRVAAGLPACVVPDGHCPIHDSREAASLPGVTASTTSTHSGGLSGC
jgi:hypothetical protein